MLTWLSAVILLLILEDTAAAGNQDCRRNGQNYDNLAIIDDDNGCARLQCQFGQFVTYYEACGKEVDGRCHRLNLMFEFKGNTYQCQKVQVGPNVQYRNELAIPRVENCLVEGRTYRSLEKFRRSDGCREYQCQNGEIVPLDPVCGKEIDGKCHLVGEYFNKGGTTYTCTSRVQGEETVFKNVVLDPQPTNIRPCQTASAFYKNFEVFRILPLCNLRQCQDKNVKILTNACAFKRQDISCYHIGEQWHLEDRTYFCGYNETTQQAKTEIIGKGYGKCKRAEKWYDHLQIHTRLDGCTSVQCQDGKTLPVQEGCLWNEDNQCHDLNSVWRNDKGVALKCILTEDGLYRVVQLDENGNIIDRPLPTEVVPVFADHCPALTADIIFVLDASGSIVSTTFQKILNFTSTLTSAFTVGPNNVHFALIVFSDVARKIFNLKDHYDRESLSEGIRGAQFLGDITETQKALNLIVDDGMFQPENGGRKGVPNIVILVTDGNSTNTTNTITAANRVKDEDDTKIIVVGVGHIDARELTGIASDPDNIFSINSYEEIFSLIGELSERTCQAITPTVPPPTLPPIEPIIEPTLPECENGVGDVIFLLDSSAGVGTENFIRKKDLVADVLREFNISLSNLRVGTVLISSQAQLLFDLDQFSDAISVIEAIRTAPYLQGERNTGDAFDLVLSQNLLSATNGGRSNVPQIVISLIDGPSADSQQAVAVAQRLRDQGAEIVTVGIDNYKEDEVVAVTGVSDNVYRAQSYSLFKGNFFDSEFVRLVTRLCDKLTEDPEPTPEPQPQPVIDPTSGPEPSSVPPPDPCNPNPCDHNCTATETGFQCSCRSGYITDPDNPNDCLVKPCTNHAFADIIFVADSSDSIGAEHYNKTFLFIDNVIDAFTLGDEDVRVGAIIYSWDVIKLFDLKNFTDKQQIKQALFAAPYLRQSTLTHKALSFINSTNMFGVENGGRPNARKLIILLTDGRSGFKDLTIRFAQLLKDLKIWIITIGVGKQIDKDELKSVATDKKKDVYTVNNYSVLQYIENRIVRDTCTGLATPK